MTPNVMTLAFDRTGATFPGNLNIFFVFAGVIILFFYAINYSNQSNDELDNLFYQGNSASEIILSDDANLGILSNGKIDQFKLNNFYSLDYQEMRTGLGIKDNFYFKIDGLEVGNNTGGGGSSGGSSNLVSHYSFDVDETATGLITDDSGNGNTATCGPAGGGICPTYSMFGGPDGSGNYNYAGLDLNVYLTAGTGSDFETLCVNGCTFSAWANSTIDGDSYILGRWDNSVTGGNANEFFYLRINLQEDTVFFFDNDGNTTNSCSITYTAGDINLNQWYNYAGVWNPSTSQIHLYRDGILLASQTCLFSSIITGVGGWGDSESTFIGTVDDGSIRNEFNGIIDNVRFYNKTLNSTEILDVYNGVIFGGNESIGEIYPVDYIGLVNSSVVKSNIKINRFVIYKNKPTKFQFFVWT